MKVIILTGRELRHIYVRMRIANEPKLKVIRTYCCGDNNNDILDSKVQLFAQSDNIKIKHLNSRKQIEFDMFGDFINFVNDNSNPVKAGFYAPNEHSVVNEITKLNPDLILVYGSCIIREPLIKKFSGRIINVHLGLSPYYRGAASNYWPLVNNEPEYVGCTFMYLDEGIDTGKIIHQIRPYMDTFDGPHQIGNRLIKEMSAIYAKLVLNFDRINDLGELTCKKERFYQIKDYTSESVKKLYRNFNNGMIQDYIENQYERNNNVPISQQKWLCQ